MNTLGQVIDAVIQDARRGDPVEVAKIVQRHYYTLCRRTDWQPLRNKATFTFGSSTSGQILPADLIGIMTVIGSDYFPYKPVARAQPMSTGGYRGWLYVETPTTPLQTLVPDGPTGGLTVAQNATSFTGSLAADYTGEYIRFGQEPGLYKLTGAATFTPAYRGPQLESKPAVVRPASTRYLNIVRGDGEAAADTVSVYYWTYPEPLYQEWQEIMLPATRALELMCIIDLIGGEERKRGQADQFRLELENPSTGQGAWADMLTLNPKFVSPAKPRDRAGQQIMFGRRRTISASPY